MTTIEMKILRDRVRWLNKAITEVLKMIDTLGDLELDTMPMEETFAKLANERMEIIKTLSAAVRCARCWRCSDASPPFRAGTISKKFFQKVLDR